jgi:hypothetical protein
MAITARLERETKGAKMKRIKFLLLTASIPLPASALLAQTQPPCSFLSKTEAEAILGESVVERRASAFDCWYVQNNFAGGKGPNNKQIHLSIWRSTSPKDDDVSKARAAIAADLTMASMVVKDVLDFADAAIWAWTPSWGRFEAFKGGTVNVEVIISGIDEDAALQNAKKLAGRVLGGTGSTGFAYAGWRGNAATQARAKVGGAPAVESPKSYQAAWMGQKKVVRGTVSHVGVDFDHIPQWLTIHFRESPNAEFIVCSPYPDMFQDKLGELSALVGKTLEVSGQVEGSRCGGKSASIFVNESQQFRLVGGPSGGRVVALAGASAPTLPRLEGARVGLDICNAGEAPFDSFVAKQGSRVASAHLAPRDCAHVYEASNGSEYVGFAFADAHGHWGAPRRIDLLPNSFGSRNGPTDVWSGSDHIISVKRGARDVSLPMQMLFRPPVPVCRTSQPYSAVAHLPLNATYAQRAAAYRQDANMPAPTTTCDSFDYTLNVVAYPDTREVDFERKCADCPLGQAGVTSAEQRAGVQQTIGMMSRISPMAGQIIGGVAAREDEQQLKESLEGQKEFRRMTWSELNQALANVRPSGGRPQEMPEYLIIRGTVSRIDVSPPQASEHWVNIYFRESPEEQTFNICTSDPEILVDIFGPDFRSRMIGQVLEVEGEYQRNYCEGRKGSIRVTLAHQVRKVTGH